MLLGCHTYHMSARQPLSVTHPEIAKQADGWDPSTLTAGSGKKVLWKCEFGHIWMQIVGVRTRDHTNFECPICSGRRLLSGFNDLQTINPELANEAKGWNPSNVFPKSGKKVNWIGKCGHTWTARIASRSNGDGCPICRGSKLEVGQNDFASKFPDLSMEAFGWDPRAVVRGNKKKFNWRCANDHIWQATIDSRTTARSGCPYCSGRKAIPGVNDLVTTHPKVAAWADGWEPKNFKSQSNLLMDWRCEFGHRYRARIYNRVQDLESCPYCNNRKVLKGFNDVASTHPEIASQAIGWDPTMHVAKTGKRFTFVCSQGHIWKASLHNRVAGTGCPECGKYGFSSNSDGWIYLIKHQKWRMLQIGITNFPVERLKRHEKLGWEMIEVRGPMDGLIAREWETSILRMLKRHDAIFAPQEVAGKFDGYTEAWLAGSFHAKSVRDLMDTVRDDEESFKKSKESKF